MNLWGFDVSGLDLDAFFAALRIISLIVSLLIGVALLTRKKTWLSLIGVLTLTLIVWAGANFPSVRLYGIQFPGDRLRNVAWCATVAAGHHPLRTGTVGQTSLEPFWALLVGTMCRGRPEKVHVIYPFLSAAVLVGLGLLLYLHFRRWSSDQSEEDGDGARIRGLLIAFFALLVAMAPLDHLGPYRGYWNKMFLLKPNHALGLLFFPVLFGFILRPSRIRVLLTGIGLGLLGWVFIVHWVFFCFSLGVYLLLRAILLREGLGREIAVIALALVLSAVIVAPYYSLISREYPHALTTSRGSNPAEPMQSVWGDVIPKENSLLTLVTLDQGWVFYLGIIGVADWLRGRRRYGLLWASLLLGAYPLWILNSVLYFTARSREGDEFYYFLVFALSVSAGNGAYRLSRLVQRWMAQAPTGARVRTLAPAGLVFVGMIPLTMAYWWNPLVMDAHFRKGLEPLPPFVEEVTDWVVRETEQDEVLVGTGELIQWVPPLTGRSYLSPHGPWKDEFLDKVIEGKTSDARVGGVELSYIVSEPKLWETLDIDDKLLNNDARFQRVFQFRHLRIYRIR